MSRIWVLGTPDPEMEMIERPLRPVSYRAAVRRFRQLCDIIERYADPQDTLEKARLTRAIHGLAYAARGLSERHRRAAAAIQGADARGGVERGTRDLRAASAAPCDPGGGAADRARRGGSSR